MAPGTLEEATRMLENLKLSINVKTSKSLDICERIVRDLKVILSNRDLISMNLCLIALSGFS